MRSRWMVILLFATLSLQGDRRGLAADEKTSEQQSEVSVEAAKFIVRCICTAGKPHATKLDLHRDPVLRWSNPTAGDVHGEIFVWTEHGRPAIVASYFHWFSPDWGSSFEISSCTETEAAASVDGVRFWQTREPGLKRKLLEGVDPPAKNAAARLVQMRRMANEFVVNLEDTRTNTEGIKRNLRLLNRPLFRHPTPTEKSQYVDGAMFAFVEGTDPEILLVLEAVEVNGAAVWNYGLARMNRDAMKVKFRDAVLWTAPHLEQVLGRATDPYAIFSLREPFQNVDENAGTTTPKDAKP